MNICFSKFLMVMFTLSIVCAESFADIDNSSDKENVTVLKHISVCGCRIFAVSRADEAKKILSGRTFIKLTAAQVFELTLLQEINLQKILNEETKIATQVANAREEMFRNNPTHKSYQDIALEAREYSNHLKKIVLPFNAYLVQTKYFSKGTGSYSVEIRGDNLNVYHGSLQNRVAQVKSEFLVIFIEQEIANVEVNAGAVD